MEKNNVADSGMNHSGWLSRMIRKISIGTFLASPLLGLVFAQLSTRVDIKNQLDVLCRTLSNGESVAHLRGGGYLSLNGPKDDAQELLESHGYPPTCDTGMDSSSMAGFCQDAFDIDVAQSDFAKSVEKTLEVRGLVPECWK